MCHLIWGNLSEVILPLLGGVFFLMNELCEMIEEEATEEEEERRRRRRQWVQSQKQKPHTMMWRKKEKTGHSANADAKIATSQGD